jgi:hypothetical protein
MRHLPWWSWAIGVLVIALAVGGGVLIGRATAPEPPTPAAETTDTPRAEATGTGKPAEPALTGEDAESPDEVASTQYVRVYLARGEHLGVALRPVPATKAIATAAVQQLLLGPTVAEQGYGLTSAVPAGTQLLGLTISGGTARVNLSGDFASGGGTLSMTMRLGQLVYTLTQFPTVERVVLLMDGQVVEVFSGEGLVLDRPQVRADFESALPALFVEGPTPGETTISPVRIWGTGNTFEASFMVRIKDPDGRLLAEVPGMATSGTGTRGTFDITVPFTTMKSGVGSVEVYEQSARDGSDINVVVIPVKMLR